MSLLKSVETNPSFSPRESKALPERLIAGDPAFKTWAQDVAKDDLVHTGVWEATPGETRSIKGRRSSSATSSPALSKSRRTPARQ
ncbi:hypothetical protein [Mesorhizobium sp. M1E.F.Ca.ET.045.02.1.1]|uniref:hypothetical protein n=1 Tax=Mesorhizobium sp. M1E.F.Ca.ET.045.02.1.1 TaxID=2493672 RepID=UPI001FDF1939|nr:hypothetical protein [Mesorhizobium sp. M1E.F.Ca.ET.045.02.1.1]